MALFALKKEAVLYYMSHFTARGKKMIFFFRRYTASESILLKAALKENLI
jgi:hypothetical protein